MIPCSRRLHGGISSIVPTTQGTPTPYQQQGYEIARQGPCVPQRPPPPKCRVRTAEGGKLCGPPEGAADRSGRRRGEQRAHKIMLAQNSTATHATSLGTREFHFPRLPGHWIYYHRDVI